MEIEKKIPRKLFITEGKAIESVLRNAIRQALITHKKADNPIATWKDGKVVIIPPTEIPTEDNLDNRRA